MLKDNEWMVREHAAWALKQLKAMKSIKCLFDGLNDPIRKVRNMCAWALAEIGSPEAIDPLKRAFLKEENREVKAMIEMAISRLENKQPIESAVSTETNQKQPITSRHENEENYEFVQRIKEVFEERVKPFLEKNPGIIQKELYKHGIDSSSLYWMERTGLLKREKAGNSFRLFLLDNPTERKNWSHLVKGWEQKTQIVLESYLNSEELIKGYFGEETLNRLFKLTGDRYQNFQEYNKEFGHLFTGGEYTVPLLDEGACLKFDMNEPLKRVIDSYWTRECDERLREFYCKYGFFSDGVFIQHELKNILGEDRIKDFYAHLEADAKTFKVKWCGCGIGFSFLHSNKIPRYYAQCLQMQWKLKPEIFVAKCVYCQREFYPYFYLAEYFPYGLYTSQILNCFPIEKSIQEINFCPDHFPIDSYGTFLKDELEKDPTVKERMKKLLKDLCDNLEFIPPRTFHRNLYYLKGVNKKKFDKAIAIICNMPPLKKKRPSQPKGYEDIFGSWFQALAETGILEGGVRKTARGYICLSKDGYQCRSIGEKIVDDYLFNRGIPHEHEPFYPGEKRYRADWKVGSYYIELWGLQGEENYDQKIIEKRRIAKEHGIPLIEIVYSDLKNLDKIFIVLDTEINGGG